MQLRKQPAATKQAETAPIAKLTGASDVTPCPRTLRADDPLAVELTAVLKHRDVDRIASLLKANTLFSPIAWSSMKTAADARCCISFKIGPGIVPEGRKIKHSAAIAARLA